MNKYFYNFYKIIRVLQFILPFSPKKSFAILEFTNQKQGKVHCKENKIQPMNKNALFLQNHKSFTAEWIFLSDSVDRKRSTNSMQYFF